MKIQPTCLSLMKTVSLVVAVVLSPLAFAEQTRCEVLSEPVLVQRTIPDPQAVKRSPLTSDRLNTLSTRTIDARRGLRPYSSVFGCQSIDTRYAAFDDHFGISRPEDRPYSYAHRTPRSYVTQFRNDTASRATDATTPLVIPRVPVDLLLVPAAASPVEPTKPDMTIRVHRDRSAIPTTMGAVIVMADGTVIQVGD